MVPLPLSPTMASSSAAMPKRMRPTRTILLHVESIGKGLLELMIDAGRLMIGPESLGRAKRTS
jgi:hypothetical protein